MRHTGAGLNAQKAGHGWKPTAMHSETRLMQERRAKSDLGFYDGAHGARSHRRFALLLVHFIPDDLLAYSVPVFLKRQCDRTLGSHKRLTSGIEDMEGQGSIYGRIHALQVPSWCSA